MRSVMIFIKGFERKAISEFLSRNYISMGYESTDRWVDHSESPVLYIELIDCTTIQGELEARAVAAIVDALGGVPTICIQVGVSGRVRGDGEIRDFVEYVLSSFPGIATDDYTDYPWSLPQILLGDKQDGHRFFDYEGWYNEGS